MLSESFELKSVIYKENSVFKEKYGTIAKAQFN